MISNIRLHKNIFNLNDDLEVKRISESIFNLITRKFRKRGAIVALSGGIDSTLCTYLSSYALKKYNVLAILMPEVDSSREGLDRAINVAEALGIRYKIIDISETLESIGCYKSRDNAIRSLFPDFNNKWKYKIVIKGKQKDSFSFFNLVVERPDGNQLSKRIPHDIYLELLSAMNYKQRIRKTIEYYYADLNNYVVIGTPNRVEFDQGFFVKNGDGSADIKPIAHLYKTQIYMLAKHMDVNEDIINQVPTTDTYSLTQDQHEFYFSLPFPDMDYALWAINHNIPADELASFLDIDLEHAKWVYDDIRLKRKATIYNHHQPCLIEDINEVIY